MTRPDNIPVFITSDGSPTLDWQGADGVREKMHHSGGALTESLYIYHSALCEGLNRGWPTRLVSVGLGLGYNEWIALAELYARGLTTGWQIWSFESEAILRTSFVQSLTSDSSNWEQLYRDVGARVAAKFQIEPAVLREFALTAMQQGRLQLLGAFPPALAAVQNASCVFYDAYSKKMSAELWEETQLVRTLANLLAPEAILATYAATGSMNRALKHLGFKLHAKPGFAGKRESTWAIRSVTEKPHSP